MARHYKDWLRAYLEYSQYSEAPKRMHFWTGVSTIAGALRRHVWIDQVYFRWHPNFYIIFVAPPGIVSKSTTVSIGMSLLRQVPGIKFGPDIVTWPALIESFSAASEAFEYQGAFHPMSPLTLESSEFGNLLNPQDRDMVDLLVSLWDGKTGPFEKKTKHSGNDLVENPWINLIACTTPAWIAGNFPEYLIGGGFTSRCVFVYAERKARLVAYPSRCVPEGHQDKAQKLVADLQHIATNLKGEYALTPAAYTWGTQWYEAHYASKPVHLDDDRFGGYLARKQTHIHKLAMVLAASSSDTLIISAEHLQIADEMVTDLEAGMTRVFSRVGKTEVSNHTDRIVNYVARHKECSYVDLYRYMHTMFPSLRNFEDVFAGLLRARKLKLRQTAQGPIVSIDLAGDQLDEQTAIRAQL